MTYSTENFFKMPDIGEWQEAILFENDSFVFFVSEKTARPYLRIKSTGTVYWIKKLEEEGYEEFEHLLKISNPEALFLYIEL